MRITYTGPIDAVEVDLPDGGTVTAVRGQTITVPDDLGKGLLEQEANWRLASLMGDAAPPELRFGISVAELCRISIASRRRQLGWSQRRLAEQLAQIGVRFGQDQVAKLETGRREIKLGDLVAFAAALNTTPARLLAGAFTPGRRPVSVTSELTVTRRRFRQWATGNDPLPRPSQWENMTRESWTASFRRATTDAEWGNLQRNTALFAALAGRQLVDQVAQVINYLPAEQRDQIAALVDTFSGHVAQLQQSEVDYPSERPQREERRGRPRHTEAAAVGVAEPGGEDS